MSNPNVETAVVDESLSDRFLSAKLFIDNRVEKLPLCFCRCDARKRLWMRWVEKGDSFVDKCSRQQFVIRLMVESMPLCFCRFHARNRLWVQWVTKNILED